MAPETPFEIPDGETAKISIIDTTFYSVKLPTSFLMGPPLDGFEVLDDIPSWSFLIESATGRKVLFDLGVGKSLRSPKILEGFKATGAELKVEKDVADILKENGIAPTEIESVIWSHNHFDHIGDMSTFPNTTELVVGPDFKKNFPVGYPTDPDSHLFESDWKDRTLRQIDFDEQSPTVGPFRALDFFGNGSFYLLGTPGHTHEHLAGLVRTTKAGAGTADTFMLLGGDLCHHGSEVRPSPQVPLPPDAHLPVPDALRAARAAGACPGGAALYRRLNEKRGRAPEGPFFDPTLAVDVERMIETIQDVQKADASENIFFVFAHDATVRGVVDLFPKPANDWKEKGWRERTFWAFLKDLGGALIKEEEEAAK